MTQSQMVCKVKVLPSAANLRLYFMQWWAEPSGQQAASGGGGGGGSMGSAAETRSLRQDSWPPPPQPTAGAQEAALAAMQHAAQQAAQLAANYGSSLALQVLVHLRAVKQANARLSRPGMLLVYAAITCMLAAHDLRLSFPGDPHVHAGGRWLHRDLLGQRQTLCASLRSGMRCGVGSHRQRCWTLQGGRHSRPHRTPHTGRACTQAAAHLPTCALQPRPRGRAAAACSGIWCARPATHQPPWCAGLLVLSSCMCRSCRIALLLK